jgi:hypothetical protein
VKTTKSYIGLTLNSKVKKRLRQEANRHKLSLSSYVSNILSDHVGLPRDGSTRRDGRLRSGRRPLRRIVLSDEFREMIIESGKTITELRSSLVSKAVKGHPIPISQHIEDGITKIAGRLGFTGKTHF